MNRKISSPFALLVIVLFSIIVLSCDKDDDEAFTEVVKIALRDVGNELLLKNQDSTSLVLPIVKLDNLKYRLTFKSQLSFEPGTLVAIVQESLEKASLPKFYRVEVVQCLDKEVAYSYRMTNVEETTIVPCGERILPEACYIIEVKFTNKTTSAFNKNIILYILGFIGILGVFLFYKRKAVKTVMPETASTNFDSIGSFQFYPEQNKLIKAATEINLSKKECELLVIFAANPNQIIKRDELTKKVWEDNGVFVGRSLDTYISKLRKKLKDDDSIKLTNVHGVGYKLEVLR